MFSFDLKSGYHHIDIHPDQQTFLGFAWKFPGEISCRYFVFTVLPFGLSSTPYISTKCLKPVEKYWRIYGVNIALFLDDGWLIDFDHNSCVALASNIRSNLKKSKVITNEEKSQWCPSQIIEWLGIVWNAIHRTIRISYRREQSIKKSLETFFLKGCLVSASELSSSVGKNYFRSGSFSKHPQNYD